MAKHYTLFFSNSIAFILIFFNYFASEKWWANRIRGFVRLLLLCRHCGYFSFSLSLFAILFDVFFLVGCAGCWMRFHFFFFILEWKVSLHCSSSLLTSSSSNFIAFCACELRIVSEYNCNYFECLQRFRFYYCTRIQCLCI